MNYLKKYFIRISVILLSITMCITLCSCKVSKKFADKINNAYKNNRPYTYNDVMLKLGETFDKDLEGTPSTMTGVASWYQGYGSKDSDRQKFIKDNSSGKKIKAICIEFSNGYAIRAEYFEVNNDK